VEKPFQYGAETMPPGNYVQIEVADTGTGISPENLPRIFEPFFTTKERGRGTGLGLAVVHGIIANYEGACAVVCEPDAGTRFSVYLPLAATQAIRMSGAGPISNPRGRERILIVDDEVDITDMLAIGLERLGYEAATVNDPYEALDAFAEAPAAWDAVITDQLMPRMEGLALAEKLKALRPDVVIILCTGLDDGTIGPLAKARGVDAFLVKPVEPEEIATTIRGLLPSRVPALFC
jgi:CheY-like chemotaxis protein